MFFQKYNLENFVEILVIEHNEKIVFVGRNTDRLKDFDLIEKETQLIKATKAQLDEYVAGKRCAFDIKTEFVYGTDFQKSVWMEIAKIPYGLTISYLSIANTIGSKALRAVGTACGENPLAIIIPCHRVIKTNGEIGNYAFGSKYKKYLLELESSIN